MNLEKDDPTAKAVKLLKDFLRYRKLDAEAVRTISGERLATRKLEQAIHMMGHFINDIGPDPDFDAIMREQLKMAAFEALSDQH